MVRYPKKIKVAPFVFSVVNDPELLSLLGGDAALSFTKLTIAVDEAQACGYFRDSLFHELIHACYQQTELNDSSEAGRAKEEDIVAALTPRLLSLLRDNPALVRYLLEAD